MYVSKCSASIALSSILSICLLPLTANAASFSADVDASLTLRGGRIDDNTVTKINDPLVPKCERFMSGNANANCSNYRQNFSPNEVEVLDIDIGHVDGRADPDGTASARAKIRSSRLSFDLSDFDNFQLEYSADIRAAAKPEESAEASYTIFVNAVYQGLDDDGQAITENFNPLGARTNQPLTAMVDAPADDSLEFNDGIANFTISPTRIQGIDTELTFQYLTVGIDIAGEANAGKTFVPENSSTFSLLGIGFLGSIILINKSKKSQD